MSRSLDVTGVSGANLITNEVHSISTLTANQSVRMSLNEGLFFFKGLSIVYTDSDGDQRTLTLGQDYSLLFAIHGVGSNNPIYAEIVIQNTTLSGSLSVTYQALGGKWSLAAGEVRSRLSTIEYNPDIAYLGLQTAADYLNGKGEKILLDSAQSLVAAQAAAAGAAVALTLVAMPNPRGASANPTGSVQFDALRGFNPSECLTFVLAANGDFLPLDSLAHTYTYDGGGNKLTDTVVYNAASYRKTFVYTGGNCTSESAWEKL